MKPVDVNSSTFFDFNVEKNDKYPKFEVVEYVEISKYKSIFAKCFTQKCLKTFLWLK